MFDLPFPESIPTIRAQLALLRIGRKPAVLIPTTQPGGAPPPGLLTQSTAAGLIVAATPEKLAEAVAAVDDNSLGLALGYGIRSKPDDGDRCVYMHDGEGREILAVVTNAEQEPVVLAALGRMAGDDFKVGLVSPLFVVRQRLAYWSAFYQPSTNPTQEN